MTAETNDGTIHLGKKGDPLTPEQQVALEQVFDDIEPYVPSPEVIARTNDYEARFRKQQEGWSHVKVKGITNSPLTIY